jgi:flagellar motor switch protein FliG
MTHISKLIRRVIGNVIPKQQAQSIMEELDNVRNPINIRSFEQEAQSIMDEIRSIGRIL